MELNYFKDLLFDVLNESDELNLTDIRADNRANKFFIRSAMEQILKSKCKRSIKVQLSASK